MARMSRVCKAYGYTPTEYRNLTLTEVAWLDSYQSGLNAGITQKLKEETSQG